jgi:D-xylose transport system ATP-binding protein
VDDQTNGDYILEFNNITKRFPGVTALDNVTMKVRRGEIHGLCGENGAGKSTLMKILSGVYPYGTYEGQVLYDGKELKLESSSIQQAMKEGIAIVYQELTLVPSLTVGENVYLGKEPTENGIINWNKLYADTRQILKDYKLDIKPNVLVKKLGVGKMQMVEIAKALSENARVLILDEPTSALTEAEIVRLMEILKTLKEHGVTCIYISHKLEEFFRITDSVTVLRDGKAVITKLTKDLTEEKVVSYMVGREIKERFPKGNRKPGEVIFEVKDLHAIDPNQTGREVIDGVTFSVRRGEIFGIAGLMGSGRTELVTTIFGEYGRVNHGEMWLDGKKIKINSSREAMDHGLSLVPEDRKGMGLVLIQSIVKNISLPNLAQFIKFFINIDQDAEMDASLKQGKKLDIKTPNLSVLTSSLSGGNQQKVVIAKWLLSKPKILIMDEGAKLEIYRFLNELAESGVAIIMISSELEEVLGMSDRVMVMHEGHSNGILEIKDADQERVMALATGIEIAEPAN